jgi:cathepsin L
MVKIELLLLVFVICGFCGEVPTAPTWPSKYTASGFVRMPYGYGISQPFNIIRDGDGNKVRVDFFGGENTYIYRGDQMMDYMIIPRIDQRVCFINPETSGETLPNFLPDITKWTFMSTNTVFGKMCNTFEQSVTNLNKTAIYTFHIEEGTNKPVRLILQGYDFVSHSHPDLYIFDYESYYPGYVDEDQFQPPELCNNNKTNAGLVARTKAMMGILHYMVTPATSEDSFDQFSILNKKKYSPSEYAVRKQAWEKNMEFIDNHNKKGTFTTKMNHYGDLTWEEFTSFVLPLSVNKEKASLRQKLLANAVYQHPEPTAEELALLPATVDWRDHNAVTMVKDQGICGSCWVFGSIASLEGQWAIKTGLLLPLSEQQVVDCAWTKWASMEDDACDGGFAPPAFDWMVHNGGVALEDEYRYIMIDGYCFADRKSSGVVVKGYVNVTSGSEAALQSAVAMGPVAVALDTLHPEFIFYESGVFYLPTCKNDFASLGHEVVVVGYGTDPVGGDYWLVKNSWSEYWGDNGYIKMARNRGNNCGIATQAVYPLV